MKTGIELIAIERQEQIEKHGFTPEHDSVYDKKELAQVASVLIDPSGDGLKEDMFRLGGMPEDWDIDLCMKMIEKPYPERLIIAGALIAAELDRVLNEIHK